MLTITSTMTIQEGIDDAKLAEYVMQKQKKKNQIVAFSITTVILVATSFYLFF